MIPFFVFFSGEGLNSSTVPSGVNQHDMRPVGQVPSISGQPPLGNAVGHPSSGITTPVPGQPPGVMISRPLGPALSPPSTLNSQMPNIRPVMVNHQSQMPVPTSQPPSQIPTQIMTNSSQVSTPGQQPPVSVPLAGTQAPVPPTSASASQTQVPSGSQLPQKNTRVTSVSKPAGIDPLLILQERENR